ncbi:hypothetical protein EUX98_g9457 [Antrodiella citrinella]|uniref:Uncharacterized protein n=1 Tax=Antrodiella citrinella TaxID=2447956 RepID=A0A4S4LUP2_9APHY|nr:hypothetical protein EUX98_g9457 [Antrodiella citrinella]
MQNYNQSILSLFDPLRTPATPERDAASPDLSDKENDGPSETAGQVTVFFNRVYKHPSHQTVKTPRGKLIDYDLTAVVLPDREEDDMDEDEEEGGMVLDGLEADAEEAIKDEASLFRKMHRLQGFRWTLRPWWHCDEHLSKDWRDE